MEGLDLDSIKIPKGGERVYKEECIYSFDTPVRERLWAWLEFQLVGVVNIGKRGWPVCQSAQFFWSR